MDNSIAGDDDEEGEDAEPTVIPGDSARARDVSSEGTITLSQRMKSKE